MPNSVTMQQPIKLSKPNTRHTHTISNYGVWKVELMHFRVNVRQSFLYRKEQLLLQLIVQFDFHANSGKKNIHSHRNVNLDHRFVVSRKENNVPCT